MSDRVRDTKNWYEKVDPLAVVDPALIKFVHEKAGKRILDLGSGPGGYAKVLSNLGHSCYALDINTTYVEMATRLGVEAAAYDGRTIPLASKSVDTVIAIEVLEHVADPAPLIKEIARVTKVNFIASVPNCSQNFGAAPVMFNHMLDVDHKNFFTRESLTELLSCEFPHVDVQQIVPIDKLLAAAVFPEYLSALYRVLLKVGLAKQVRYFRLLANARASSLAC